MKIPYLLLNKAQRARGQEKPDESNKIKKPGGATEIPDFSKDDGPKSKDKNYKPAMMRGLPEPPTEGDVVEFHHPKHGMKTRGRVTAVGQDGYKARVSDGSAIDVPHSHTVATLPVGDYGSETGVSPQDAKDAFLGPTKEGGLPATPLQIAILDVLGQYGFPVDEDTIHTINYDQAKRIITKYVMDDRSVSQTPDTGEDDDDQAKGSQQDDEEDTEVQGDEDQSPQEGSPPGQEEKSPGVPGGQAPPGMTPPTGQPPKGPSDPSQAPLDGTDVAQDGSGPAYELDDHILDDPEVASAVKQLISALETTSQAPGTPDEETTGPKDALKHPRVKNKIGVVVNASSSKKNKRPPNKKR